MGSDNSLLKTGVDKLVDLVARTGKVSFKDAAKELGVGYPVIEEWAEFLEEEGLVSVEYHLTKPYLVERKLSKTEVEKKAKDFSSKKDVFLRKSEGTLTFLENEAAKLKDIKTEFDKLQKELGIDLDSAKEELDQLEGYEKKKQEIAEKARRERAKAESQLNEATTSIERNKKLYDKLVGDIRSEEQGLQKKSEEVKTLERVEQDVKGKIAELQESLEKLDGRISEEDRSIQRSEKHLGELMKSARDLEQRFTGGKDVEPLLEEAKKHEQNMRELQDAIIKKIKASQERKKDADRIAATFKRFFDQKLKVEDLVTRLNKDREDLYKEMSALMKKAKSFQLASNRKHMDKEIADMEKKFDEVNQKKSVFEKEFNELKSLLSIPKAKKKR